MSISLAATPAVVLAVLAQSLSVLDPKTVTFADIQAAMARAQELMQ